MFCNMVDNSYCGQETWKNSHRNEEGGREGGRQCTLGERGNGWPLLHVCQEVLAILPWEHLSYKTSCMISGRSLLAMFPKEAAVIGGKGCYRCSLSTTMGSGPSGNVGGDDLTVELDWCFWAGLKGRLLEKFMRKSLDLYRHHVVLSEIFEICIFWSEYLNTTKA